MQELYSLSREELREALERSMLAVHSKDPQDIELRRQRSKLFPDELEQACIWAETLALLARVSRK
jgi:hypothetical protein